MSKHRRRRSSKKRSSFSVKKKRSGLRTIIETVMGVSIGLLILGIGIWWYFLREPPEQTSRDEVTAEAIKDNVVDSEAGYEQIRDHGSIDDLFKLLSDLDKWPRGAETPVRLSTLGKRLEIAQTILERKDITEDQRVTAAKATVNAMGQIYGINYVEELDEDGKIASEYLNISGSFANDPNEEVQKAARVARIKAHVYESVNEKWDGDIDDLAENFESLIANYPNDTVVLSTIQLLTKRFGSFNPDAEIAIKKKIVAAYESQSPENNSVLTQLRLMKDTVVLNDANVNQLTKDLLATGDIDSYVLKVGELMDMTDTGVGFLNSILEIVGLLESKGHHEYVIKLLTRLQESVPGRPKGATRSLASRIARFGLIRNSAVGKKMDFNGVDINGEPVDIEKLEGRPCIVAYYSPNQPNAQNLINQLNAVYEGISSKGIQIVTVGFEKANSNVVITGLRPEWVNVSNGDLMKDEVCEIFRRLPVSQLPYFATVDHNGIVDRINIALPQIRTRVDNLLLKQK